MPTVDFTSFLTILITKLSLVNQPFENECRYLKEEPNIPGIRVLRLFLIVASESDGWGEALACVLLELCGDWVTHFTFQCMELELEQHVKLEVSTKASIYNRC